MANGRFVSNIGSSTRPLSASGSHIFSRHYYRHHGASGDVRGEYKDLEFTSTGSGETVRLRGIANGTLCATGGTINAIHATGRVASGKTVSGQLNAGRFTLEVAGTTPTPGGTLASLLVDTNISTGWTAGTNDAFIRFNNAGAGKVVNLFHVPTAAAKTAASTDPFVARHADAAATHGLRIIDGGGTVYWIMVTTDTPGD